MRAGRTTVDVLASTMDVNSPEKGAFALNMFRRKRAWETRPGFGQLAQHDTTMARPPTDSSEYGYERRHGCWTIRTDFGHLQVVSIWRGDVATGNAADSGSWQDCWFLLVYDKTAGTWQEIALHAKTAGFNRNVRPMPYWRGVYETNSVEDNSDFLVAGDRPVWFHEHGDRLLFGSRELGVWCYNPCDFGANTRKQVDATTNRQWSDPYSESAAVVQLVASDGVFSNAFDYVQSGVFPRPEDACSYGDRVVYVSGKEVFFSDFGRPGSVMSRNILFVPADEDLVACEVVNDMLLLFSPNETWLYQPSLGTTVTQGRLVQLSQHVGALNAHVVMRVGGRCYWLDRRGVYMSDGSSNPQEVGDALQPLFDTSMSSPLYNYFAESGHSDLSEDQPRTFFDLLDTDGAHVAYESGNELLLFTFPSIAASLVWSEPEQSWSIWSYESFANGDSPVQVEVRKKMLTPWLSGRDEKLFMVCGPDVYATSDTIDPAVDAQPRSVVVLEWGRGGGIDRSVDIREDNRQGHGYYSNLVASGNTGIFYVGEPIKRDGTLNEKLNRQTTTPDTYYLLPVYLHPNAALGTGVDGIKLHFAFDNTEWTPVFTTGASTEIDFILPSERWTSRGGWGYGAAATPKRVECTDAAGTADRTGIQVRLEFDGPTGGGAWSHSPSMNLQLGKRNLLMFLPFTKDNAASDATSLDPSIVLAQCRPTAGAYANCDVWWFQKMEQGTRNDADSQAQAVDWAYKTPEIAMEDSNVRLRGLRARMVSHGAASAPTVESNWIYGVLNLAVNSDWKSWSGQLIDYAGEGTGNPNIDEIRSKSSLRKRFIDSSSSLAQKVFGTSVATWGSTSNADHGNLLIDDEQNDEVQFSAHVSGGSVTGMVFGHIRSRAEKIVLSALRAVVQPRGGRRRRGR